VRLSAEADSPPRRAADAIEHHAAAVIDEPRGGVMSTLSTWGRRIAQALACVLAMAALAGDASTSRDPLAVASPGPPPSPPRDLITERAIHFDVEGSATIETISRRPFEPAGGTSFLGNKAHPIWLRVRLAAPSADGVWWLTIGPPIVQKATVYVPIAPGRWRSSSFGNQYAFADRTVQSLNFVEPLNLRAGEATELFIRLETPTAYADVRVQPPQAILERERLQVGVFTLWVGVVAITFCIAVMAYVTTRQSFWLSSAAHDLASCWSALIQSGLAAAYVAPHASDVFNKLQPAVAILHLLVSAILCAQAAALIRAPVWLQSAYRVTVVVALTCLLLAMAGQTALALRLGNLTGFFLATVLSALLVLSRCGGDAVLVVAVKVLLGLAGLFFLGFFGPYVLPLDANSDWRRFTAIPGNVATIAMGIAIAFRLSYLDAKAQQRSAAEAIELRRREEAAVAASQAKTAFLAFMSHEIRTPLNAVVGLAELAGGRGLEPGQREQYLQMLQESAESLTSVISDTLDLSRIEAGKLDIEPTTFSLGDWLDSVHATYFALATRKGLGLHVMREPGPLAHVTGDPVRLRQIIGNFLSNALKFTDQGDITLVVKRLEADRYRFEVRDTGRGIGPDDQSRLFTAYAQAGTDAHTRARGSGMGLAICRELARLMGGEVGVDSALNQGSCFWLAVRLAETPATPGPAEPPGPATDALCGRRILVADDDPLNRTVIEALLRREGALAVTVADGAQAIDAIQRAHEEGQPFDIAFLDIHMRGMGGIEAIRDIRRLGAAGRLPVIALTGSVLTEQRLAVTEAGMDDLLPKPVRVARLREVVQRHARPASPPHATRPPASSG
jgi:signal transduction histidine kinase/CheY-like chemotaxis protein